MMNKFLKAGDRRDMGSSIAGILSKLGYAVLEYGKDGSFRIMGEMPAWMEDIYPELRAADETVKLEGRWAFLENFIIEAARFWEARKTGYLKSGPWTETDDKGQEYTMESTILCLHEKNILLLKPLGSDDYFEEKQRIIQKSREKSLQMEDLAKSEKQLRMARDELEKRIDVNTRELMEATAKLGREEQHIREMENQLKLSLDQKEILGREIRHRVFNNMQIIGSLLSLHASSVRDSTVEKALLECHSRVISMSLVYERAYLSEDLSRINFQKYIRGLLSQLIQAYKIESNIISIIEDVDDVTFQIETAIPCGMIIRELVSNAIEHAFPGGSHGTISVKLKKEKEPDTFLLIIEDSGIGMLNVGPPDHGQHFGIQLAHIMMDQLDADYTLETHGGTSWKIRFCEQTYKKRI